MSGEGGSRLLLAGGALMAAAGIALGAMAAHLLQARLDARALSWWQTAANYQMWNAVGLVALGAAPVRAVRAGLLIGAGTILFSGTLYAMALTGETWLARFTPVGGVMMIAGWLLAAFLLLRRRGSAPAHKEDQQEQQ
jgi:uncharacterized membrane protein YgdD (TMEM256/DUF423 family)